MTKEERDAVIEQCAAVIDRCNREGPYQAIAGARRIRALKDIPRSQTDLFVQTGLVMNRIQRASA